MAEFLVHFVPPSYFEKSRKHPTRPLCNTGFFIRVTSWAWETTCPDCKQLIKELENKKHGTNNQKP
jgi:hypothetical protein